MKNENLDFLIFDTVEYVFDAATYGLVAGEMYYIIDYALNGCPVIELDHDKTFELLVEELQYTTIYSEDFEINENFIIEDVKEEAKPKESSTNGLYSKIPLYGSQKIKAVDGSKHDMSDKEVNRISKWLDEMMIEKAINDSIENKDVTAFNKVSKVLRRNKLKNA